MLESLDHAENSFVTLTYAPAAGVSDLVPKHLSDWLKRLRKRIAPRRVRFFAVGEFGTHTGRPHFHCALFGWPSCRGGPYESGVCQCVACSVVRETWGYGHVLVGTLEMKSAQYIAGYVTKKMTRWDDPRLNGRHPEFARMSLRPGIGASAMWNVASEMMRYSLEDRGDVPLVLLHGGRRLPLGRYLVRKLREMVGKDAAAPPEALQEAANQLLLVRAFAFPRSRSVKSVYQEVNEPFAAKLGARDIIRGKVTL